MWLPVLRPGPVKTILVLIVLPVPLRARLLNMKLRWAGRPDSEPVLAHWHWHAISAGSRLRLSTGPWAQSESTAMPLARRSDLQVTALSRGGLSRPGVKDQLGRLPIRVFLNR
jgi:hypothetical protein